MASNGNGNGDNTPVTREKPLNQTQLKNLRELVHGDFKDLQEQISIEINRRTEAKVAEVQDRFRDIADLEAARQKVIEFTRRVEDEARELKAEILNGNGSLSVKEGGHGIITVTAHPSSIVQEGRDDEIAKINKASYDVTQTALRVLNRERRAVDRQCLLQGIGAYGAHELIRDLPQPDDILPLVGAELQARSEESLAVLFDQEEIRELTAEAKK